MTREQLEKLVALLGLLALAGCSGGAGEGAGSLAVSVKNARSFDPKAKHGRIETYEVKIEGEGIASPIVSFFPGDAEEGVIEGVPVGEERTVSVSAANPNGATIRAGETSGVRVTDGLTEVSVEMEAVPIFTNVADGAVVDNTRMVFRLFSDPKNPVVVEEVKRGGSQALVDASTNAAEIALDVVTGEGRLSPSLMEPGSRRFAVKDLITGRRSEAGVLLLDGTKRRPAPIFPAAVTGPRLSAAVGGLVGKR